jgi:hypothetical protein
LEDVEERLKKQLGEMRQELEKSEMIADTQFDEIYKVLIELTSQKKLVGRRKNHAEK